MPKIALLAGGAIALAWLAVQAAAVEALTRRSPVAAATFAPDDPRIPVRLAMIEFRQNAGRISQPVAQAAIRSLQQAPLAEEPFLIAGLGSLVRGDEGKAEALLVEARRRNPRAQTTRILLLDRYLRRGRVQEAASEIAVIGRLVPGTSKVLTPQLAKFVIDPKTRATLVRVLRSDPGTREMLLNHLAGTDVDSDIILELAGPLQPPPPSVQPPAWQELLLRTLVSRGEIAKARSLWIRFSGANDAEVMHNVYDGSFRGLAGAPPFNWQFASSAAGAAEPTKRSELQVDYYGRADAELASQLLVLSPGRYRLAFLAAGEAPEQGGGLSWRVVCHPDTVELASVPIANISYAAKPIRGEFVVPPSGCPAQWLRLVGTPAEFPATVAATLSKVQIERAGTP